MREYLSITVTLLRKTNMGVSKVLRFVEKSLRSEDDKN